VIPPSPVAPNVYSELPSFDQLDGVAKFASPSIKERVVGFSGDDAYLAYTLYMCDPCPAEFHFEGAAKRIKLAYHYDPRGDGQLSEAAAEARRKTEDDAVDRRLAALGAVHAKDGRVLRGPFPFPDLTFATTSTRDDANGKVTLLFGAHVDGEDPVYPIHVVLGPHPMLPLSAADRAQLAAIPEAGRSTWLTERNGNYQLSNAVLAYANVTRDGSVIGVVAIAIGSLFQEVAAVARLPVATFVGQVYDETGQRHQARKDYANAAALFDEAVAARPNDPTFARHLACARARSDTCP
jgi:hypothetical protein